METQVVKLALAIARKVVGQELQRDPALLAQIVKDVLARLENSSESVIRIAPTEVPGWEKALPVTSGPAYRLLPDPAIPPGRCIMETSVGSTILDPLSEIAAIEEAFSDLPRADGSGAKPGMVQ